jgi:hypothetical protein
MAENTYLQIENIGNSYMGTCYITPKYGTYKDEMIEAFEIQDLTITCEKEYLERRTLNDRVMQRKLRSKRYKLSGNLFACSTKLQKIEEEYDLNGTEPMYTFDVTNNWTQDGLGKQRFKLEKVTLDSYDVLKLSVTDEDTPQAFSGQAATCKVMEEATRPDVEWTE